MGTNTRASPLVVVVDDDASVRRALRRLIGAAGFEVETFVSGRELLDSGAVRRADCAVLDIHLRAESGFEVQQRLADLGLAIPFVFITGDETEATSEDALRARSVTVVRKPFQDVQLLRAIHDALGSTGAGKT